MQVIRICGSQKDINLHKSEANTMIFFCLLTEEFESVHGGLSKTNILTWKGKAICLSPSDCKFLEVLETMCIFC